MKFNLNFGKKKQKPGPVEVERRVQYLEVSNIMTNQQIETDFIPQIRDTIEVKFKILQGTEYVSLFRMDTLYEYWLNSSPIYGFEIIPAEGGSIGAYSYAERRNGYSFESLEDYYDTWITLTSDGNGEMTAKGKTWYTYPYNGSNTNKSLKLFTVSGGTIQIEYYKIRINYVEHFLVPCAIGNKGYFKDLTTGTIYGEDLNYTIGPDYVEE